jgi:hypothetical protein
MAERSLSMREAPGSIPGLSNRFQCRGELGWRWGQTSNLVRADALEVRFLLCGAFWRVLFAAERHLAYLNSKYGAPCNIRQKLNTKPENGF